MKTTNDIHFVLEKYWGYEAFRPLQQDIIESVLNGNDTLALLPTGGGKSICFQVPALSREGLCIVITPLIALMKDQVYHLNVRNIKAAAVYSGLSQREILQTLENAVNGRYGFLYISPERLQTQVFTERVIHMPVNLIAVDEAHCISQWGYDFRPAYLQIAEIRKYLPETTILALTASATPEVQTDIVEKLEFQKGWKKFEKSFVRENLSYINIYEENKQQRLLRIIQKVQGTGIVYVRNRRKTEEWATFLVKNGLSADFYHAGLDGQTRNRKQDEWIEGKTQIMVCTNAFGMGIDKPDVRLVVHMDICESLEAYYQEAGRAGRDGKPSYCVILYDNADLIQAKRTMDEVFPTLAEIKEVYHALFNFFKIAYYDGRNASYGLDLIRFKQRLEIPLLKIIMSFRLLEQMGFLTFSEAVYLPSKLKIIVSANDIEDFQQKHPTLEPFIKVFLRSFPGLFEHFVSFREHEISAIMEVPVEDVSAQLIKLEKFGLIDYLKSTEGPSVTFLQGRMKENGLVLDHKLYEKRKQNFLNRRKKIIHYVSSKVDCRSRLISVYFGEKNVENCGKCDVCRGNQARKVNDKDFREIALQIKTYLADREIELSSLLAKPFGKPEEKVKKVIRFMTENGFLIFKNNRIRLK